MHARLAAPADTSAIATLTRAHRANLAEWSPTWWRPGPHADELHAAWLGHLVAAEGPVMRVVEHGGEVVACAVAMPQPGQWFVDDVAVADDRAWPVLLAAVEERPALTCVATLDPARAAFCHGAGLTCVSSCWIGPTVPAGSPAGTVEPRLDEAAWPPPPRHTFGALGPWLAFGDEADGLVVASRSLTAPPVYDSSAGTVAVVDRLTGHDRARMLAHVRAATAERGDVLVAVVADATDPEGAGILAGAGLVRTVDIYAWP
jgi:hypothetical protein